MYTSGPRVRVFRLTMYKSCSALRALATRIAYGEAGRDVDGTAHSTIADAKW